MFGNDIDVLLGIGGISLLFLVGMALAAGVFWLWMLFDVLIKQREDKIVWLLVVFFLNLVGAFVYYFVARKKRVATRRADRLARVPSSLSSPTTK